MLANFVLWSVFSTTILFLEFHEIFASAPPIIFWRNTTGLEISRSYNLEPTRLEQITQAFFLLHLSFNYTKGDLASKIQEFGRVTQNQNQWQLLLSSPTKFPEDSSQEPERQNLLREIVSAAKASGQVHGIFYGGRFTDCDYNNQADFLKDIRDFSFLRGELRNLKNSSLKLGIQYLHSRPNYPADWCSKEIRKLGPFIQTSDFVSVGLNLTAGVDNEMLLYSYETFGKVLEESFKDMRDFVGRVNPRCEIVLKLFLNRHQNFGQDSLILQAEHAYRWAAQNNIRVILDLQGDDDAARLRFSCNSLDVANGTSVGFLYCNSGLTMKMNIQQFNIRLLVDKMLGRSEIQRNQLIVRNVREGGVFLNPSSFLKHQCCDHSTFSAIFKAILKRFRLISLPNYYNQLLPILLEAGKNHKISVIPTFIFKLGNDLESSVRSYIESGNGTVSQISFYWGKGDRDESKIPERIQILQNLKKSLNNTKTEIGLNFEMDMERGDIFLENKIFQEVLLQGSIDFIIWDFGLWPSNSVKAFPNQPDHFLKHLVWRSEVTRKYKTSFPNVKILMKIQWGSWLGTSITPDVICEARKRFWETTFTWGMLNGIEILVGSAFDGNSWPNFGTGWWSVLNHDDYSNDAIYQDRFEQPCPKLMAADEVPSGRISFRAQTTAVDLNHRDFPGGNIPDVAANLVGEKFRSVHVECPNVRCVVAMVNQKSTWTKVYIHFMPDDDSEVERLLESENIFEKHTGIYSTVSLEDDGIDYDDRFLYETENVGKLAGIHVNVPLVSEKSATNKTFQILRRLATLESKFGLKIGCLLKITSEVNDRFLTLAKSNSQEDEKTRLLGNNLEILQDFEAMRLVNYTILDLTPIFKEIPISALKDWILPAIFDRLRGIRIRLQKLYPSITSVKLRVTQPERNLQSNLLQVDDEEENSRTVQVDVLRFYWSLNELARAYEFPLVIHKAFEFPGDTDENGWWRVKNESDLSNKFTYIEKEAEFLGIVEEEPEDEASFRSGIDSETVKAASITTSWNWTVWIIVGAVILVTLSLVAIIVQSLRLSRAKSILSKEEVRAILSSDGSSLGSPVSDIELKLTSENGENVVISMAYDKGKWEIPKSEFKFDSTTVLGFGNFGVVRKAMVWRLPDHVAVKVPKIGCSKETLKSLVYEIKIMSFIGKHENVLQFLGAFTEELQFGNLHVVTELCSNGSLQSHLRGMDKNEEGGPPLLPELIRFSTEIARGMEYISERNVIHGDLSTRNVLLGDNFTCKVADFGLSRKMYQYETNYVKKQGEPLPWRWLAIESMRRLEFSTMSDVWAYGVTLWEIFSLGEVPWVEMTWDAEFMDKLDKGLRLKCPKYGNTPNIHVHPIMMQCWEHDPGQRPTFHALLQHFEAAGRGEYTVVLDKPRTPVYANKPRYV